MGDDVDHYGDGAAYNNINEDGNGATGGEVDNNGAA
jgi:hypothetical protein